VRLPGEVGAGGLIISATADFQPWQRGSGYMFAIGSDGMHLHESVLFQSEGKVRFLRPWTQVTTVSKDSNRLAALIHGNTIQFYLNGELRWSGTDRSPGLGAEGLFATSLPEFETTHAFDNVRIRKLPEFAPRVVEAAVAPSSFAQKSTSSRRARHHERHRAECYTRARSLALLRPGLIVRVSVLVSGKREIDSEVKRISDSNVLDLPLVGAVPVEGMTLNMLIADLQKRYQDFFINPQVIAEFIVDERPDAISPWGSVNVLGRVRAPGRVNIPPT
jgi:hypothetical protein